MAGSLRPNPPSPLELNGRWKVGTLEKKVPKKLIYLNGLGLYPPPPLNGPAIKIMISFPTSLNICNIHILYWELFFATHFPFPPFPYLEATPATEILVTCTFFSIDVFPFVLFSFAIYFIDVVISQIINIVNFTVLKASLREQVKKRGRGAAGSTPTPPLKNLIFFPKIKFLVSSATKEYAKIFLQGYPLKTWKSFNLEPKFFSFKIIHFRLFLFQKHIYLYLYVKKLEN